MTVHYKYCRSEGFTLIEMSIVLVIIGLIVGSVVAGQTLVRTAQLRNQIKQFQDYQIAFNTFITKYNCLPGDCSNATTFFGTTDSNGNTIYNGNGNGQIDTSSGTCFDNQPPCGAPQWSASREMSGAFQELAMAHMIAFVPTSTTSDVIGVSHPSINMSTSNGFVFAASYNFMEGLPNGRNPMTDAYQTGSNALWFTHCSTLTSQDYLGYWDNSCAVFTATDLQAMDQKMDDGQPLSGKLFGFGGYATVNDCLNINGPASTYKTTNATPQCQAAFVIN